MYCVAVRRNATVVATVPRIAIKTGYIFQNGHEEVLTEYMCDVPDCPNIATHVLSCVRELGIAHAVCGEHLPSRHLTSKDETWK